jgi:flagellar protein FlbT
MYLKSNIPRYRAAYMGLVKELQDANPASRDLIDVVNNHISDGALYKALKEIRKMMKQEDDRQVMNA